MHIICFDLVFKSDRFWKPGVSCRCRYYSLRLSKLKSKRLQSRGFTWLLI